jgi:hypothetical protein
MPTVVYLLCMRNGWTKKIQEEVCSEVSMSKAGVCVCMCELHAKM